LNWLRRRASEFLYDIEEEIYHMPTKARISTMESIPIVFAENFGILMY